MSRAYGATVHVNGHDVNVGEDDERPLLALLRDDLRLTGAKPGCGEGACGACTVLVDGRPEFSCRLAAHEVADASVVTVEGIAGERLHPVQQAIVEERASQCGYCTPGMVVRAFALLENERDPGAYRIAEAMAPSICRCGCYRRLL